MSAPVFQVRKISLLGLAALLTALSFPEIQPEFGISTDGPLAWLYNELFNTNRAALARLVFPHGPLDFLQSPLPIGRNLEIALVFQLTLRAIFAWSGLRLALQLGGQGRFWATWLLLAVLLELNTTDVLLSATVGQLLLLAAAQKNGTQGTVLLAIVLTAIGLLIKLATGLPAAMMLGLWLLVHYKRNWVALLGGLVAVPLCMSLIWYAVIGSGAGLSTFFQSIYYLSVGNSAAVCHYPENNWLLLSLFLGVYLLWPQWSGRQARVSAAWLILLPGAFAFWKYGFSREDIWHLHTTFRYLLWAFGMFMLVAEVIRPVHVLLAGIGLSAFYMNMRVAEGWKHVEIQPIGLNNLYEWVWRFEENKALALAHSEQNIKSHILPDSTRQRIGDKTVDCYPYDYSWAAANDLRLQPRPIPQSYAAYHPWLMGLDRAFLSSAEAPDFIIFHLKPYQEGNELKGLDGRNILHDEPAALLALLNRYRVVQRNTDFLLLEKTTQNYLGTPEPLAAQPKAWASKNGQSGLILLQSHWKKSWRQRICSFFYKESSLWADVHFAQRIQRVKLVPALLPEGLLVSPWQAQISRKDNLESWNIPDSIRFNALNNSDWHLSGDLSATWYPLSAEAGWFLPIGTAAANHTLHEAHLDKLDTIPPQGFGADWQYDVPALPDSLVWSAELSGELAIEQNQCANLVLTDANDTRILYASMSHCAYGINDQQFWPISMQVALPAGRAMMLKAYLWNTTNTVARVKNVHIRIVGRRRG